jgi:hypothetical protein
VARSPRELDHLLASHHRFASQRPEIRWNQFSQLFDRSTTGIVDRDARVTGVAGIAARAGLVDQGPAGRHARVRYGAQELELPLVVVAIDSDPVDPGEIDVVQILRWVDRQIERSGRGAGVGEFRRGEWLDISQGQTTILRDPERPDQAPEHLGAENEAAVGRDQGLRRR